MTPFLFIEQHEIRLQLDAQSEGFSFASIEISVEDLDQHPVLYFVTVDPSGVLHLPATRMRPSSMVELVPDTLGDVNPTEQLPQELELADCGETGEG